MMTGQGTQECPLKQVGDEVVAGGQEEVARFLIFILPPSSLVSPRRPFFF